MSIGGSGDNELFPIWEGRIIALEKTLAIHAKIVSETETLLVSRLAALHGRLETWSGRFEALPHVENLDRLHRRIDQLGHRLHDQTTFEQKIDRLAQRVNRLVRTNPKAAIIELVTQYAITTEKLERKEKTKARNELIADIIDAVCDEFRLTPGTVSKIAKRGIWSSDRVATSARTVRIPDARTRENSQQKQALKK